MEPQADSQKTCRLCGALLAVDNPDGICSHHPRDYDPCTDPEFGPWLELLLRANPGVPVRPLEELRRAGRAVIEGRRARNCVNSHVERLRRNGAIIIGLLGGGGYVFIDSFDASALRPSGGRE